MTGGDIKRLGRYRVDRKLADGGMGSVYLGAAADGTSVVLKVPHAQDRDAAVALADEARMGARLKHAAVVETLDFFIDAGRSVLVVAYIDGLPLFEMRRSAGPLPASAVVEMGHQLAGALDAIHNASDEEGRPLHMLHRDVSPNNVLVGRDGQVRLIDLGIARSADRKAKATMAGMVKGTLRYLAPEILQGGEHSPATDLWALGLTLWEAAIGRYAVPGDTMLTMRAAIDGSITRLKPGERVDDVLMDALLALVAPVDTRLTNARAAANVFGRIAQQKLPGGRAALAAAANVALLAKQRDAVGAPSSAGAFGDDEIAPATEITARAAADDDDVASVFTSTSGRDTILQMAAAPGSPGTPRAPAPLSDIATESFDRPAAVDLVEGAATINMPLWSNSSAESKPPPQSPAPPAPPARAKPPVDVNAPTQLQMPAAGAPRASPPPKVSLFIPIVVVDDEDK